MFEKDKSFVWGEKKRIILVICFACSLFLLFAAGSEEQEISAGAVTVPAEENKAREEKSIVSHRILGAEKAALNETLSDPFSIAHLTREEKAQAKLSAEKQWKEEKQKSSAGIDVYTEQVFSDNQIKGAAEEEKTVILQGIVSGERGRLAIFRMGDSTVCLGVGEKLGDRTLTEIGRAEAGFDNGEHVYLKIP